MARSISGTRRGRRARGGGAIEAGAPSRTVPFDEQPFRLRWVPLEGLERGAIDGAAGFPTHRTVYLAVKRGIDVTVALAMGLVALLLLAALALLIRLDTPGPVFYHQTRVGKDGRLFRIHKLRTMTVQAEASGAVYAVPGDPRVTRVGRVLRKARLDELPQLWNVVRGDMSLVGPRPERPELTGALEAALPGFALRTRVRPGLTGWAQVWYPYAGSIEQYRRKLEYDLYYIRHASVWLDMRVLAKTVVVVVLFRGY